MFVLLYEHRCEHLLGMRLENRGKAPDVTVLAILRVGDRQGRGTEDIVYLGR